MQGREGLRAAAQRTRHSRRRPLRCSKLVGLQNTAREVWTDMDLKSGKWDGGSYSFWTRTDMLHLHDSRVLADVVTRVWR